MKNEATSSGLLNLLSEAIARELQVCIQYMLQHAVGAGQASAVSGKTTPTNQGKFVASHSQFWLPGSSLKKTAIAEMRHAEAIAERVVLLGGEPTTQPGPITIGKTAREMLENDREKEREAIELYRRIIDVAGQEHDDVTMSLFRRILSDEEKHHRVFSNLLGENQATPTRAICEVGLWFTAAQHGAPPNLAVLVAHIARESLGWAEVQPKPKAV